MSSDSNSPGHGNDPFNIVKEYKQLIFFNQPELNSIKTVYHFFSSELRKSINKVKSLLEGVNSIQAANGSNSNNEAARRLLSEVRIKLKSITWDLQDLEATIGTRKTNIYSWIYLYN